MAQEIYILSSCDAWAGRDSMWIQGVTTDETMLYAMLAAKIKAGDMEYSGFSGEEAYQIFSLDFKKDEVDFNKLQYGFVQTFGDVQIEFPEAATAYDALIETKAQQIMETLGLERRSLLYSMVDLHSDYGWDRFFVPGICTEDKLMASKEYSGIMSGREETSVSVDISCYRFGQTEKYDCCLEECSEQELELILNTNIPDGYESEIYLSDEFDFTYKPEEMEER